MPPHVKTSIAPGSRIASDYFATNSLQESLDALGFETVGYGCTTCIGNSGPLNPELEQAVRDNDIVAASVLSGNRNFEARIHASIKTNFLMSPPWSSPLRWPAAWTSTSRRNRWARTAAGTPYF